MSSSSNILMRAAHGALGVLNRVRAFFFASGLKSTSRVLVEQINTSLRLQPVSIACQAIGAAALVARFWDEVNRPLLILWALAVLAAIGTWGLFHRRFISDAERGAHIREWLQRWMMHTLAIGVVWGFAGAAFLMTQEVIDIVILVAVVVTVVFASWPVFSCWMPSLTLLVICALAPMMLTLAAAFDLGRLAIGAVLLVVVAFVLYCGRRLNEIVVLAVTREVQNERLVARLKSEKALAESERRATALASERRAKFFAGANHDLRQPLQAMGIYLQILQMQADDRTREVVEQLDATARSISTLVEQLLEVSRIEAGNLEVKMECVRIEDLMRDLAGEFEPVAAVKGLKFSTRPLPVSVKTDPMLVGRILRNLITNAIRYTNRPGARIVLAARRLSGGRVTIGVYDQGPGIARSERRRIFEAFYRGEAGKASDGGFGLGLSIVSGLARRLGIGVSVGSRPGRGSVFRLEFASYEQASGYRAANPLQLASDLDVRGVVGLLEDNDIVRGAVAAILTSWGATVVSDREPSEKFVQRMIAEAEAGNLSALISDYNLGESVSTGLEVIFTVRLGAGRDFPCVLLTAVSEDEIRRAYRALCLNPDNEGLAMPVILQKPAAADTLASALRRAIAENRPEGR
ncbi:MAG: HAMP domain-containing sensor histidine kinase [Duodenibacillus sp.]|mgnify:CR=1 FL=1|nr:HAMP domain-containing sensor histidine kinase [Duodenibacillus sp.]